MSAELLIQSVEQGQLKDDVPAFGPGDTVRVHAKVVEGDRERIQVFEGVVIRRRSGGVNENFTVRRTASHGIGVERTFLIHSPRIDRIEVVRAGRVRRSKLYYLRSRTGRAARIRERRRPDLSVSLKRSTRSVVLDASPVVDAEEATAETGGSDETVDDEGVTEAVETSELEEVVAETKTDEAAVISAEASNEVSDAGPSKEGQS